MVTQTPMGHVSYAIGATLDKQSCVITSTLFEMNSTCMHLCDFNFSYLSTSITSAEVASCPNNKRIQIQYCRPCLHFVSSNINFVNLWQWLAFPCSNRLKVLILFASFSIITTMHIYELLYQSDFSLLATTVATQTSSEMHGCGCLPLWAPAVHRTSHARLMDFLIKSWNTTMSMWITRISYILFVFIILTCYIKKNMRPYN